MDLDLSERTVLLAGAGRGIGRATAIALAAEGASLVLCGRDERRLAAVCEEAETVGGTAVAVAGDLREPAMRERLVKTAVDLSGILHGVVNTAGGAEPGDPLRISIDAFQSALSSKFLVQLDLARTACRHMLGQPRGGVIVNVVGVGGIEPFATHLPGGAANAALLLATKGLARHVAPNGVRLVALSPGLVATETRKAVVAANAKAAGVDLDVAEKQLTADIPAGRMATVEDVASVIAFLLSPRSSYFTGSHIVLDGGYTHGI